MSDHRCNGHETEALRELLSVGFVSAHLCIVFFSAVEDSFFPRFHISGRGPASYTQGNSNRLNTFFNVSIGCFYYG